MSISVIEALGHIDFAGLSPREVEIVVFADKVWPSRCRSPQFLDVSQKLGKAIGCAILDGRVLPQRGDPWLNAVPPTFGKLVVRHPDGAAAVAVRCEW